jgi:FAD/FMN-containing dehydrogenase
MCLADGTIVPVSTHDNPDLFWGIRGGHGQFGVVLEYTIQVYPDGGQALVGMLGFKPEDLGEVLKVLHEVR